MLDYNTSVKQRYVATVRNMRTAFTLFCVRINISPTTSVLGCLETNLHKS